MAGRKRFRHRSRSVLLAVGVVILASPGRAQTTGTQPGSDTVPEEAGEKAIWERSSLLGDAGGVRPWLGAHGVTINLTESFEALGNVAGGLKRGATVDGLADADRAGR